jgi:hypothetical protein
MKTKIIIFRHITTCKSFMHYFNNNFQSKFFEFKVVLATLLIETYRKFYTPNYIKILNKKFM